MNNRNTRLTGIVLGILSVFFIIMGVAFAYLFGIDKVDGIILSGTFVIIGLVCLAIAIRAVQYGREEEERNREREQTRVAGRDDMSLRPADFNCKFRVFIGITLPDINLKICYRRVKSVNELIVNDAVYDEKRGVIEFAHNLSAVVNGHRIDAGFDGVGYSYLLLDGIQIASKMRLI